MDSSVRAAEPDAAPGDALAASGPSGSGPSGSGRTGRGVRTAAAGVLVLGPLVLAVALRLPRLVVTSDSVAQQSVVQTWLHAGHGRTYLPPDTWLLKLPVYLVVEALPLSPPARLLAESVILAALGVVLLAVGMRLLLRHVPGGGVRARRLDVALPLAWLGTLGGGFGQYLAVMPNSRNIELGLALCLVAGAARVLRRPRGRRAGTAGTVLAAAAAAVVLGLVWVDDPYVAFLVGLPLAAACAGWFVVRERDRALLGVAAVVGASLLAIAPLRALLGAAGVQVVPDATGVTLNPADVSGHLPILWPALGAQIGLRDHGDVAGPANAAALAVLAGAVVVTGWLAWQGWRRRDLPLTFLALHWPVVVAGVLVNRTIYDFHAGRYLVLAIVDLAVCAGLAAALLRSRRPRAAAAVLGLLAAATAANLVAVTLDTTPRPALGDRQEQTLALLEGTGATKGVSGFWAADLYTHQSGGRLLVSDVACQQHRLRARSWLTDSARLAAPATRTFVLWDPTAPDAGGCTADDVRAQFGEPALRLTAPAGGTVWVYDADIVPRTS